MADNTTIEVSKGTWRELNALKHPGDSFDDAVHRLFEQARSQEPAEQPIDGPVDEWNLPDVQPVDLGDIDVPGQGQILEQRREAIETMVEEIHSSGRLLKGELLDLVDVEELGYQDPQSAWKNCFQPALQELDAVEVAGASGLWLPS